MAKMQIALNSIDAYNINVIIILTIKRVILSNVLLSTKKLTVNPKSSIFSKLKNHIETALTKAKKAIKDIKFAIIAPIFPITLVAPCEIASKMFFASLFIFYINH
jgi:hypothetical protein